MDQTSSALSRRRFARILGTGAAVATVRPWAALSEAVTPTPAAAATVSPVVRLSSNENPYGPSQAAMKAMTESFSLACRYPDEHVEPLLDALSKMHGVTRDRLLVADGSSEILKLAAAAFTGPGKPLALAEPTFEAIAHHARVSGAELTKVALTADYRHDLLKMLGAAAGDGLVYVCNPNNPTASITPKDELRDFIASVNPRTILLVDEAYHHYVEEGRYESVIPLTLKYPHLIVARTFSKIYGMAGLRCGYCVASPGLIERMRAHQTFDSTNIMALVAAHASLNDPSHVAEGKRLNTEVKKHLCAELDRMGYRYIPSAANFIMIDVRRDVRPLTKALQSRSVEVGRFFPALPSHMRVTIGTRDEIEAFLLAFRRVTA